MLFVLPSWLMGFFFKGSFEDEAAPPGDRQQPHRHSRLPFPLVGGVNVGSKAFLSCGPGHHTCVTGGHFRRERWLININILINSSLLKNGTAYA